MKLAVVVQRYGADVSGGAELHARYLAERLSHHAQVEVLTSCARDYITWRNELPPGPDRVQGVEVHRFPVCRERDPVDFGRRSELVFDHPHSLADELAWLESEGPASPALIEHLRTRQADYDYLIFFSYRYYHAYHGARAASRRAVLVPTAERDAAIGLAMFGPIFRGVRAVMYNSFEERAMIEGAAGNHETPGIVVGIGSELPAATDAARFRRRFNVDGRFAVYVGRIDANKGCAELFAFFQRYAERVPRGVSLVLIGSAILPIPDHPRIRYLGFLDDQDKFDAIAAADLLIMPSPYESLSMVALEAWGLGRPVLANGRCDVLKGQCIRSNAGLYYESYEEFLEALHALTSNRALNAALGRQGAAYFRQHYAWPVIDRKYLEMFDRLRRDERDGRHLRPMESLPGWLKRRRRTIAPARERLAALPSGAVTSRGADPPGAAAP